MKKKKKKKRMTRTGINFFKNNSNNIKGKEFNNNNKLKKSQRRVYSERDNPEEDSKIEYKILQKNRTEFLNEPIKLSESINLKKNNTVKSSIIAKESNKNLIKNLIKEFEINHRRYIYNKDLNMSQYNIKKNKNKKHINKKDNFIKRGLEGLVSPKGREKYKNIQLKKNKSLTKLTTIFELNINESFEKKYDEKYNNPEKKTQNQKDNKYKTSSNFFQNKKPSTAFNFDSFINKVLENNKKAAQAKQTSHFFNDIGKDFLNNHMRSTRTNFYSSHKRGFTGEKDTNFTNDILNDVKPNTLNCLKITLLSPLEWRKHEEIWNNINSLSVGMSELEKHLIPPNDKDVLISSYLKLYPNVLHFVSLNSISTSNKKNSKIDYLSFNIDDNINNPKLEMKKWKDAYKRLILRWHPDKLYSFISEIKLKDENIGNILRKQSTIIINNMNSLYKNIIEILRKILRKKDQKNDE